MTLDLGVKISDLPRESCLRLGLFGAFPEEGKQRLLGWASHLLVNVMGDFSSTVAHIRLWENQESGAENVNAVNEILGFPTPNFSDKAPEISVRYD